MLEPFDNGSLMQEDSLQYQIYPRIDKLDCRTDEIGGGAGPTAQTQRRLLQSDSSSNAAKLGLVCASGCGRGRLLLPSP